MKKTCIFMALMLLFIVSVSAQTYSVKPSTDMPDANQHGAVVIPNDMQYSKEGETVRFSCSPNGGYGLVRGPFYAVKNADGTYGDTKLAKPESTYPEDLVNEKQFSFIMPKGNVEVWAYFDTWRVLVNHKAPNGWLKPHYGRKEQPDTTLVYNVPGHPIKLIVVPDGGYELVDVKIVNASGEPYTNTSKSSDTITVRMPNKKDTIHVTPIFGKNNYNVTVSGSTHIQAELSSTTPKSREEVEVTLISPKGYIPVNFSITGCELWWRVGKPVQQEDGGWKTVYRFKVDLQDVAIKYNEQQVYAYTINDTEKTGRIQTLISHPFPDYPGVACKGQQIPVVFMMPDNFSASYTVKDTNNESLPPLVYHNELENSFADKGMSGWQESGDYQGWGLSIKVDADADGNKYWSTSVLNRMSQGISIAGRKFPVSAYNKNGKLSVAAIASINPRMAREAKAYISASHNGKSDSIVIANLKRNDDGWQTIFKTFEVDGKTDSLKFHISSLADDLQRKRYYDGPQFTDLCLLIPVNRDAILNEDVLVFTMGTQDVTINYTPKGKQNTVSVNKQNYATVTLLNKNTGEEGESVKAIEKDVISIVGAYDEGHAIYDMACRRAKYNSDDDADYPKPDSVDLDNRKIYYHYIISDDQDVIITPQVDVLKVDIQNNYGGSLTVDNTFAKKDDKVVITVTPNAGCKLKQIRTFPAGLVTFKEENVDATTGGGTYSFIMTTAYITLTPEFIVPIATADEFLNISEQDGDFNLTADLDLGNEWNQQIYLWGHLNGNGHHITYGGTNSLLESVDHHASVRHLYVKANVNGNDQYIGGITKKNFGIIEDCEVTGTLKSADESSHVGGVAGLNTPDVDEGIISRCHVLCDAIDGASAYGIAYQQTGATAKNNVFNGKFIANDKEAYMICNDASNTTIEGNYYVTNSGNARAITSTGMTAAKPADLVEMIKQTSDDYPVFTASLKRMYEGGYVVNIKLTAGLVELVDKSSDRAAEGSEFSGRVRVIGNNHLKSITVSASDGSKPQDCKFTDNEENVYTFSFIMPGHDVLITFTTEEGKFIYTPQQFVEMNDMSGKFFLARDLDLNDWEKKINLNGTFYGNGHTIRYHSESSCVGLFQLIRSGAVLQDLRVVGLVRTTQDCGGIALNNQGIIRNCHFSGRITKFLPETESSSNKRKRKKIVDRVSAIACIVNSGTGKLDHCSATAELKCIYNQEVINKSPLCYQTDIDISTCKWIDPSNTDKYQELLADAEKDLKDYPVYAQGIIDKITPCIIAGNNTIRVENGKTLEELTLVDGEPFRCTGDIKVNRIVYKRNAMTNLEQWVLPFEFDRIAGDGTFEYHKTIEENKMPDVGQSNSLTLSNTPASITYNANEPWLVKGDGSQYILTSSQGPITIKATDNNRYAHYEYASVTDRGNFYANYDSIPAKVAKEGLMYVWDVAKQGFFCSDSVGIQPNRFYVQFYKKNHSFVEYAQTGWANSENASASINRAAPQRFAAAMTDGWQPIFLDPREPQSITARMLDYYEVAYLTDVKAEVFDENTDSPLAAVSLVYQMVNDRMELPTALPLLVRAKRGDAEPLVNELMGEEIDEQFLESLLSEDENADAEVDFDMPHYWVASFGNRLDIWHLPLPELYADLADVGCMLFDDNYFDQSFNYAKTTDNRTTAPMSYCITVLNSETYELLPLMGDRVNVEFIPAATATGISLTPNPSPKGEGNGPAYNLSGQRVGASYKGIILQNGRKIIRK